MNISRSSALSIYTLLIFDMHELNGVLYLNATFFSTLSSSFATITKKSIVPFTVIHGNDFLKMIFSSVSNGIPF